MRQRAGRVEPQNAQKHITSTRFGGVFWRRGGLPSGPSDRDSHGAPRNDAVGDHDLNQLPRLRVLDLYLRWHHSPSSNSRPSQRTHAPPRGFTVCVCQSTDGATIGRRRGGHMTPSVSVRVSVSVSACVRMRDDGGTLTAPSGG